MATVNRLGTGTSQNTALLGQRYKGPPVCWSCNEVGHVQRYCPKKKGKLSHGATLVEKEDLDNSRGEGAFVTTTFTGGAWLVDSGASSHMTPNKEYFASYRMFDKPEKVHLGDGRVVEAVGVGNIHLKMVFRASLLLCMMSCMFHNLLAIYFQCEQLLREARKDAGFETAVGNYMEWGHWLESFTSWTAKSSVQLENMHRLQSRSMTFGTNDSVI